MNPITCLVTGGASGIGLATAQLLQQRGARVALADSNAGAGRAAIKSLERAIFLHADLTHEPEADRVVAETVRAFGSLNAVVNSAGIQRYGNAEQTTLELWREVLDVNLTAAFLVSRAAIPHLRATGGGAIINVGSVQSHVSQRGATAYVASKHALLGLTRSMAVDYAAERIRVNCVCPGTVDTPMFRWTMSRDAVPESVLLACEAMHPVGRIARPEEVAEVIAFLLTDAASFVTGTAMDVDGGVLALVGGAPKATVAELALDPEREFEIVNGKPEVKETTGAKRGSTIMRLGAKLVNHVEASDLGIIYSPDKTFTIGHDERLPDLGFVAASRIPAEGEPEGIWEIAPDLAVEVISPNDVLEKVNAKMADYFAAGMREVWLISVRLKTVSIYTSLTQVRILGENDTLTSETLLPGFRCRVGDIFGKARQS